MKLSVDYILQQRSTRGAHYIPDTWRRGDEMKIGKEQGKGGMRTTLNHVAILRALRVNSMNTRIRLT